MTCSFLSELGSDKARRRNFNARITFCYDMLVPFPVHPISWLLNELTDSPYLPKCLLPCTECSLFLISEISLPSMQLAFLSSKLHRSALGYQMSYLLLLCHLVSFSSDQIVTVTWSSSVRFSISTNSQKPPLHIRV